MTSRDDMAGLVAELRVASICSAAASEGSIMRRHGNLFARAADALDSLTSRSMEAGGAWRTIDSAPKDGTNVLLVIPSNVGWQAQSIGHWDDDKYAKRPRPYWTADIERVMGSKWMRSSQPTHWMPLPSPPALSPPVKGKE